jgi:hypothetical protein
MNDAARGIDVPFSGQNPLDPRLQNGLSAQALAQTLLARRQLYRFAAARYST